MTESTPSLSLQEMMNQGVAWLDAYLRPFEAGGPCTHSMIGIEAGALSKARTDKSLEWADIAIRAAALHALENAGQHRASAQWRAMALRAWFISKMGAQPGHPILDPDVILRWFREEAEFPLEAAKQKSARWKKTKLRDLSPDESPEVRDELIRLRNLKGRISILRTLADCGALPPDADLAAWLAARNELF